ncbi:MAG: efflux RND transporter periplasmic adaptor subunit [Chloroflexota bacterium]
MKRKLFSLGYVFILLSSAALLVTACGQAPAGTTGEPTPIPTVVADTQIVAEGRIVPADDVYLSFLASGLVDEILVEEGDQVKAGDVVARLGNREEIEAGMANARSELLAAQQARDSLFENVEVQRASLARAISEANRAVRDAQYNLDNYTVPTNQQNMTAMQAVVEMEKRLNAARAAFDEVKYRPSGDSNRKRLKEELDDAQSDYNSAVRRLELETTLKEAQARLDKATQDFAALQDGPDADDLAAADARIAAVDASIRSGEAALSNLELVATIDGTVVEQDLVVGQAASPGQPVMRIVDFSQMYVETDDLTELEVVDVSLGQKASIVADALPDLTLNGSVEKIAQVYEEKRGDITYTVRILLDNVDPRLLWGMTVAVTFEE